MQIKSYPELEQNEYFYGVMGPFFADKKFVKIFGESLYNDKESIWWVAFNGKQVAGFCAAFKKKSYVYLNQLYICEKYQSKGLASKLFATRAKYLKDEVDLRAMACEKQMLHLYEKEGFTVYGSRGKYSLVRKINTINKSNY